MDWRRLIEGIVSLAYALMTAYLHFTNIDMTPTRLLVTYWPLYLIGAVAVALVIGVCEQTRD